MGWFQSFDNDYDLPTTTTGDYTTEGWTTTASTTTEELTTTLEPGTTLTTTTDGEYTPPDITTTTIPSTELTSTTNTPSSDLGPVITVDVIDCPTKIKMKIPSMNQLEVGGQQHCHIFLATLLGVKHIF